MTQTVPGLKVGVILPTGETSKSLEQFLRQVPPHLSITCLSWDRSSNKDKQNVVQRHLFGLIERLDGRYLNQTSYRGHLEKAAVEVQPISEWSDLNSFHFDYLLSLDGSSFEQQALATTKHGALILRCSSGFWETYNRQATTQFNILLQNKDNQFQSVFEGTLLTQASYLWNQAYVTQKALYYLRGYLDKLTLKQEHTWEHLKGRVPSPEAPPSTWALAMYIAKRLYRNIEQKFQKGSEQQWNVAFHKDNWNPKSLSQGTPFAIHEKQFFADPFVITKDGRHYCFVEEFDFDTELGHISAFELTQDKAISLGTVFKEPFHLSFPFIFEYQNELFMCPETSGANEIRVYKCVEFPLKWTYEKTLMKNIAAVDSMFFEKDGRWWMLTNIDPLQKKDHCTELCAFSAASPLSDTWAPHPANPLVINPLKARNGGLVRKDGSLFRVSQVQDFGIYGAASSVHEITQLSETAYAENTVAHIKADFFKDIYGTHHLHSDGAVTVYDFCKNVKVRK